MDRPKTELLLWLEYRIYAVAIGHLALRHSGKWEEVPSIKIFFNDKQVIEGTATAFTNPAIESAIFHCRALLEFLGLGGKNQTELKYITDRKIREGDVGIENFPPLTKLTVAQAVKAYLGSNADAEAALAYVIYVANKGLAHTTTSFKEHDRGWDLLEIAFRGVPVLVENSFYVPLKIQPPDWELKGRSPDA
jgi:hypothetical protein